MTSATIREPRTLITPASVEIGSHIANVPTASHVSPDLALTPEPPVRGFHRPDTFPRRAWRSAVTAACVRVWDAALGPPLTNQARTQHKIAEFNEIKHLYLTPGP